MINPEHGHNPEQNEKPTMEVGTSGYRIEKIRTALSELSIKFDDYFNLEESSYTRTKASNIEKAEAEIGARLDGIKELLPRMEDFPFSDGEKDIILDLMGEIEVLQKQWYEAKGRYQEARERASKIEEFQSGYDEKLRKIISVLEQLPADRQSSLKFESGHYIQLLEALNKEDIEASRDIILEIDKLLTDNYSAYPKRIVGGAELRFRLEQALKEPDNPKLVNTKKIELTKSSLVIRTSQDKISVSLEGLDTDQQRIWEKIN